MKKHFDYGRETNGAPFPCGAKAAAGGRRWRYTPDSTPNRDEVTCGRCRRARAFVDSILLERQKRQHVKTPCGKCLSCKMGHPPILCEGLV